MGRLAVGPFSFYHAQHLLADAGGDFQIIVWIEALIQPFVIHYLFYLPQKMILWYQCVYVRNDRVSPRVFSPFLHDNTPIPILPEMGALA